jgi:hypothetical protein
MVSETSVISNQMTWPIARDFINTQKFQYESLVSGSRGTSVHRRLANGCSLRTFHNQHVHNRKPTQASIQWLLRALNCLIDCTICTLLYEAFLTTANIQSNREPETRLRLEPMSTSGIKIFICHSHSKLRGHRAPLRMHGAVPQQSVSDYGIVLQPRLSFPFNRWFIVLHIRIITMMAQCWNTYLLQCSSKPLNLSTGMLSVRLPSLDEPFIMNMQISIVLFLQGSQCSRTLPCI